MSTSTTHRHRPAIRRLPRKRATGTAKAVSFTPGAYPATTVGSAPVVHLLNRFAYGATPASVAAVGAAGGPKAWFDAQLAVPYDATSAGIADWWPDLNRSPLDIWVRDRTGVRSGTLVMYDYVNRTLTRRITSSQPVLEAVTDVLENHLHVPLAADGAFPFRAQYGELIRSKALGRFDDLLTATTVHPAMLTYLNAMNSTKAHPNENLARELLELHTVGVGNYTEDDVKDTARLLTGFTINSLTGVLAFVTGSHAVGPVRILGFTDPNSALDGRPAIERLTRYLANHPATARRIATKLVVRFVRDDAPAALVERLAQVYLDNGTDLRPVLKALVASDEFAASAGLKLRDPHEDLVAVLRMLGAKVVKPTGATSLANLLVIGARDQGHIPFTWPSPDGQPQVGAAWASAARASASLKAHARFATLAYPSAAAFAGVKAFLPTMPIAFRDLVDHLHRTLHQRPSTETALQACCQATGIADPATSITATHAVVTKGFAALLGALLDLPTTYQR